ncbi:hypothetical protein WDU94_003767 [Cyamophila willieti]
MVLRSNLFFILVILLVSETLAGNYPNSNNPKPCAQRKAVITKTVPICVPQGKNSWTKESQENCVGILKNQCPEFNEAECMWYTWKPTGCKREVTLPCCRLKYYAKRYTWMEIFYANQYGTWADSKRAVFDIIEIHRFIKNHEAFPLAEQNDYPDNVLDIKEERGLNWYTLYNPSVKIMTAEKICAHNDEGQKLCTTLMKSVLESQYPTGFVKGRVPGLTSKEFLNKAPIVWEQSAECSQALVDNVKTDVCKVFFKRISDYPVPKTSRTILEAQVYSDLNSSRYYSYNPSHTSITIRYAYYNYEPQPEV